MRLVAAIFCMSLANPTGAEWVKYAHPGVVAHYYDPASVNKRGGRVRVWAVQDLIVRDDDGALSNRVQFECDCREGRIRILQSADYDGEMTGGKVLRRFAPSHWVPVETGTVAATLLRTVCR